MPMAISDDTSEHVETKNSQVFKEKGVTVNLVNIGMWPGHNMFPKYRGICNLNRECNWIIMCLRNLGTSCFVTLYQGVSYLFY